MSTNNDLLEVLQADVLALLQNVPALADAVVIADNQGDIEAKVIRALAAIDDSPTGKRGLAVVVLLPEVISTEINLPGPPLNVQVEVQTIEHVTINRSATGTGLRSSQAALITLGALHQQILGSASLYADKDPVTPVKVKAGHVSHAVLLNVRANGLQGPGKVLGVSVNMTTVEGAPSSSIFVTGSITPDGTGELLYVGMESGKVKHSSDGEAFTSGATQYPWISSAWDPDESKWVFTYSPNSDTSVQWSSDSDVASPVLASGWVPGFGGTGTPVFSDAPEPEPTQMIEFSCATEGADVYYTTDGTYPTPDNGTLYSDPFEAPAVGTLIRAAGYLSDLNPGDVLGFTITE